MLELWTLLLTHSVFNSTNVYGKLKHMSVTPTAQSSRRYVAWNSEPPRLCQPCGPTHPIATPLNIDRCKISTVI